jgi:hypothetical protein
VISLRPGRDRKVKPLLMNRQERQQRLQINTAKAMLSYGHTIAGSIVVRIFLKP